MFIFPPVYVEEMLSSLEILGHIWGKNASTSEIKESSIFHQYGPQKNLEQKGRSS